MHHGLGICINLAVQATSLLGSLGGMGCCWVSHSTFASMGFQFSVSLFISVQSLGQGMRFWSIWCYMDYFVFASYQRQLLLRLRGAGGYQNQHIFIFCSGDMVKLFEEDLQWMTEWSCAVWEIATLIWTTDSAFMKESVFRSFDRFCFYERIGI